MTLLKVEALKKQFDETVTAVDDVSFSVEAGEIICLLGPSGCGKTTLLRLIAGLEAADAGQVLLDGVNIVSVPPHERDFGMMFQDFALFPHKDVYHNVAFGLQMRGESAPAIQQRVSEMLALVDMAGFENRDISQLSGGEQQRVALARSLAPGPRLLMLDEPLGALDRALRERLMLDLRTILKTVGVTAIYVTHDQTEAFAVADQVIVMRAGRIEQMASPQAIYQRPATPFVARFLGFTNLLEGQVMDSGQVATALGNFSLDVSQQKAGATVTVLIKPEAAKPKAADPAAGLTVQATIIALSFRGKYYQVWMEIAGQALMFEMRSISDWQVGQSIELQLDFGEMLVL